MCQLKNWCIWWQILARCYQEKVSRLQTKIKILPAYKICLYIYYFSVYLNRSTDDPLTDDLSTINLSTIRRTTIRRPTIRRPIYSSNFITSTPIASTFYNIDPPKLSPYCADAKIAGNSNFVRTIETKKLAILVPTYLLQAYFWG
jgi:hypothetical protein